MSDALQTRRWRGVLVVVFGAIGLGMLGNRPSLILLGAVGMVFAAYPWLTSTPDPPLALDRRVTTESPGPGEEFEVRTTIENVGSWPVFDCRIVDGVPPALPVTDGTPRQGTALLPGQSTTVSYTVEAREGRHAFDPATVVVRDASGEHERELSVGADTAVDCRSDVDDAPLRTQTLDANGRVPAQEGGGGIEFYRTRSYRPGDPMKHIDWNRFAKTAELTTIDFREERSTAVVLVVDARESCYRGRTDEAHAVARCVSAAQQLVDEVITSRNQLGLAAFGREDCWIKPDTGRRHRTRAQRLLTDHAAFSLNPPEKTDPIDEQLVTLERRLPRNAQVLFCTPLLDDGAVDAARRLDADGHAVSVVSPDVTDSGTPGRDLVKFEREQRLGELRRAEIPVVDWGPEEQLALALGASYQGVSV